jgi:hypothetical protein
MVCTSGKAAPSSKNGQKFYRRTIVLLQRYRSSKKSVALHLFRCRLCKSPLTSNQQNDSRTTFFFHLPFHSMRFNLYFKDLSCPLSSWSRWLRRVTCYRATRWRAFRPNLPLTIKQTYPCQLYPLFRDSQKVLYALVLLFVIANLL